jgi:ectoine hydroxylase-related dioxygenase (phytanoyl-CoA dioxygenase family)
MAEDDSAPEIVHYNVTTRRLEESLLSWQQTYEFDTLGYLVLPQALGAAEVEALWAAAQGSSGDVGGLLDAALALYLTEMCGAGYRLDGEGACRLAGSNAADTSSMIGGNGIRALPRAYINLQGWNQVFTGDESTDQILPAPTRSGGRWEEVRIRCCQGLLCAVALRDVEPDDLSVCLVPASHKSQMPAPISVLSQTRPGGYLERPALRTGDVLLAPATTLHRLCAVDGPGRPGAVLLADFLSSSAKLSKPPPQGELPAWAAELDPVERAVLGAGTAAEAGNLVLSDGDSCWIADEAALGSEEAHPSIFQLVPAGTQGMPDPEEVWAFDTQGFLVVKAVMDSDWISEAVAAIDACLETVITRGIGGNHDTDVTLGQIPGAPLLTGTGRPDLPDLFNLPEPFCRPFRRMLAHPAVISRLQWMIGAGFTVTQNTALCHVQGSSGQTLHAGNTNPTILPKIFEGQNGRIHTTSGMNVSWNLTPVTEAKGGFCIIPGSHKCCYPLPHSVRTTNVRSPIRHVEMGAGDIVFFLGGAVSHGAYRWEAETPRRAALFSYKQPAGRAFAWPKL